MSQAIVVHTLGGVEYRSDPMPIDEAQRICEIRRTPGSVGEFEVRALCDRCGKREVAHETTDHQCLCADCAQDTHIPCESCGEIVPNDEVGNEIGEATCIDCREADAKKYDKGRIETRRKLFVAERVLVLLARQWRDEIPGSENGEPMYQGLLLRTALEGVREAHHLG